MMAEPSKSDRSAPGPHTPRVKYTRPPSPQVLNVHQLPNLPPAAEVRLEAAQIFCAGDLSLLSRPLIAIVGAREVTEDGAKRAAKLGRLLAQHGVVTVSGLAKGVDYAAHRGAIAAGGSTIAVIGTPLSKAYPAEHSALQEEIWRKHLLVSQFAEGSRVFPSNFPARNKLMAAITLATVIVEASDTSGSLHQAAECARLNRPVFIARSVVDNPALTWPVRFLKPGAPVYVLNEVEDILKVIGA